MTAVLIILALALVVTVVAIVILWRAVNMALDQVEDIATELALERDAVQAVTRQKEEAIEQMRGLNRRIVHLDQSRDDACIEASKLRAKLAFEQQETARLTSLVERADEQITQSTRAVESLTDFFTVALMELEVWFS